MPRQGLNRDTIIEGAIELIEHVGDEQLSLRALAATLNVKTLLYTITLPELKKSKPG